MFVIKFNKEGGKWILITFFIFFLATILVLIAPNMLPSIIEKYTASGEQMSYNVLLAYQQALKIFNICVIISSVLCAIGGVLLIAKAIIPKNVGTFTGPLLVVLFCIWYFGLGFILVESGTFEELSKVEADIVQYESGDFKYTEGAIYTSETSTRLMSSFEQSDKTKVFTKMLTVWECLDERNERGRYTVAAGFLIDEDVVLNENDFVTYSIEDDNVEEIREKYTNAPKYKVGYTSNYRIFGSIEKIEN